MKYQRSSTKKKKKNEPFCRAEYFNNQFVLHHCTHRKQIAHESNRASTSSILCRTVQPSTSIFELLTVAEHCQLNPILESDLFR